MGSTVTNDAAHYHALMLDHAIGGLPPAAGLLVETHLRLNPQARAGSVWMDSAGGALLETIEPRDISATPLPASDQGASPGPSVDARLLASRSLIEAADRAPEGLNWRWRAPALREVRLPVPGASLIRLSGGRAVPAHDHAGDEFTLVLQGEYADETGVYRRGEIAFAGAGVEHSPFVPEGGKCICLVASEGALKFRGLLSQAVYRVLS